MPNHVSLRAAHRAAASSPAHSSAPSAAKPSRPEPADRVARSGPLAGIRYGNELTAAARHNGIEPVLLAAVAAQESGGPGALSGDATARQPGGQGRGLMQIDGESWAFARTPAADDPRRSAEFGAAILAGDLRATHGDVRRALNMYNTGNPASSGAMTRWPDGTVLSYADSVLLHARDITSFELGRAR